MGNKSNRKKAQISEDKLSVEYPRDEIETYLPNLAIELNESEQKNIEFTAESSENQIVHRSQVEIKKAIESKYDENSELYLPKTEDYLRRCSTLKEAKEIIDHQLKQNEITKEYAKELWEICVKDGIRHFGQKKEWGYYEKTYRNKKTSG